MDHFSVIRPFRSLFARTNRLERCVLALLCLFAGKFLFSTAAHFIPALQGVDLLGSGRDPLDVWLLLLCAAAWLGLICLYRRAFRALELRPGRWEWAVLAVLSAANAVFYLSRMWGRRTLYMWDQATYYNLQIRLESNFADGVFMGVGSTIYKTWFNDYAPLVINILTEPFFLLTDRTANSYALVSAVWIPPVVYLSAMAVLLVLARRFQVRSPRLFFTLGMTAAALFPLLHKVLYTGMPDVLGVAFALMILALASGYDFSAPAPARLVCLTVFTGLLMVTRRCYLFTVIAFFLLYAVWVIASALRGPSAKNALLRFLRFGVLSVVCVGGALAPLLWRLFHTDYADIYAGYMGGGLAEEIPRQVGYLGWVTLAFLLVGVLWGLTRRGARGLALLTVCAPVLIVVLITRVQNMSYHQSLAMAPFYLLGIWLFLLLLDRIPPARLRYAAGVAFAVFVIWNASVCRFTDPAVPALFHRALYGGAELTVDADREDFEQIQQVNAWLVESCEGENSAYMICHNTQYNPDVFRVSALPDESVRTILPYGAADPGNDAFPLGLFYAQVVLTSDPFVEQKHTGKLNEAFLQVVAECGCFETAATFDMGNGTVINAYRRTGAVTRREVEIYRAALAEEDARYPQNFSQVLDRYLQENDLL